jgi:hypothetical protein
MCVKGYCRFLISAVTGARPIRDRGVRKYGVWSEMVGWFCGKFLCFVSLVLSECIFIIVLFWVRTWAGPAVSGASGSISCLI